MWVQRYDFYLNEQSEVIKKRAELKEGTEKVNLFKVEL